MPRYIKIWRKLCEKFTAYDENNKIFKTCVNKLLKSLFYLENMGVGLLLNIVDMLRMVGIITLKNLLR